MTGKMSPKFDINFGPGWDLYEFTPDSTVSNIIAGVEIIGQPSIYKGYAPSHVWKVIDEHRGIESSVGGVKYFELSKYFDDPSCEIVACHPAAITELSLKQMLAVADLMTKQDYGYDYTGLIGDALEGILHLDDLIPALKEIPNILHLPMHLFCSALVATINKATTQYKCAEIFGQYTVSKISPLFLMQAFPYDRREWIKKVEPEYQASVLEKLMERGPIPSPNHGAIA